MAGDGAAEAEGDSGIGSAEEGRRESCKKTIQVMMHFVISYSEHLSDLQKIKTGEKRQELINKELEGQDMKAQHYEYMAVQILDQHRSIGNEKVEG